MATTGGARASQEAVHGPPPIAIRQIVSAALREDLPQGDVTTEMFVLPDTGVVANIVVRAEGRIAGLAVAREVFGQIDAGIRFESLVADGARVEGSDVVARVEGAARGILGGERVALNFLGRMSGIATMTARYVEAVAGTGARIVDTRKTTPGLRALEKYAVRCGGGRNHRFHLGDAVLVKDNHRAVLEREGRSLEQTIRRAREVLPHTTAVGIEVDTPDELDTAVEAGPDWILLDNMEPDELRGSVKRINGAARVEASGGITIETVRSVAEAGVDMISVGALTHSAPALDITLDFMA